jgi:hypothetical protein
MVCIVVALMLVALWCARPKDDGGDDDWHGYA